MIAPLGVISALLVGVPVAHAAADTQGPTLTAPAVSSYVIGQSTGAYRQITWTAKDPSGICRYTIDGFYNVEGWTYGIESYSTHATTGKFTYFSDDYENSDDLGEIRINAYDCAGNVTSIIRGTSYVKIERDYGPTVPSGWQRTSCVCAIGDSMLRTSTAKTALSTVVNGNGQNSHIALVMAKGPGRGKAAVYFDGALATTVDTYAKANINRVIMWDKALTGSANHTVKVVNLATPGRPRIDIDAYLR
jgi:hypothetical protein